MKKNIITNVSTNANRARKKNSAFRMQIAINYYAGKVENARDNYKVQLHIER